MSCLFISALNHFTIAGHWRPRCRDGYRRRASSTSMRANTRSVGVCSSATAEDFIRGIVVQVCYKRFFERQFFLYNFLFHKCVINWCTYSVLAVLRQGFQYRPATICTCCMTNVEVGQFVFYYTIFGNSGILSRLFTIKRLVFCSF
jgi:hypothetical protein